MPFSIYQACTWRNLPGDFPAWQTVYTYFRNWRKDGTWVRYMTVPQWVRVDLGRQPSPSESDHRQQRQECGDGEPGGGI